jgi:hypothetical protein
MLSAIASPAKSKANAKIERSNPIRFMMGIPLFFYFQ